MKAILYITWLTGIFFSSLFASEAEEGLDANTTIEPMIVSDSELTMEAEPECVADVAAPMMESEPVCSNDVVVEWCDPLRKARLEIGYAFGRYIGIREDYLEFGIFAPALYDSYSPFLDVRGYRFNDGIMGASAGIGLRVKACDGWAWGGNIYYDCLESHYHGIFQRIGLGVEWLGPCLDFRVNGYIPLDFQQSILSIIESDYVGTAFATATQVEFALSTGVDAEVGCSLASLWCLDFYGAVGFYSFHNPNIHNYTGGSLRFEIDWQEYITLQIRTSYDSANHACAQAEIQLNIPLEWLFNCSSNCGCCDSCCCEPFCRSTRRNGIIFAQRCCIITTNY